MPGSLAPSGRVLCCGKVYRRPGNGVDHGNNPIPLPKTLHSWGGAFGELVSVSGFEQPMHLGVSPRGMWDLGHPIYNLVDVTDFWFYLP